MNETSAWATVASVISSTFSRGTTLPSCRVRLSRPTQVLVAVFVAMLGLAAGCMESSKRDVTPLALEDLAGRTIEPFRASNATAIVFLFLSVDCPISNRYAPEVRRLRDKFASQPVAWRLVYPGADDSAEAIGRHVREFDLPGEAIRDPHLHFTKAARVRVTPEAAVFLPDGRLAYHGRIDDRFADLSVNRPAPTRRDLEQALEEILARKPVSHPETKGVGCLIQGLP